MSHQAPKPMSKNELSKTVIKYERKFKDKANTLSQFFTESVVKCWDLSDLSAAALVTLHEKIGNNPRAAFIVIELGK